MKIDRLLSVVIYLLNRNLVTAKELAERFGVSVRTIQRDMDNLQDAGIPIMTIQGPSGGYGIMDTWRMDRQLITLENLFSILTALGGINEALPDERFEETFEKIHALLPASQETEIEERKQRLYIDFSMLGGRGREKELITTVQRGIDESRLLRFEYTDTKLTATSRTIEPMTLMFKWRSWYLFGYCQLRSDYRLFRISRIRNPLLLDKRFSRRNRTVEEFLEKLMQTGNMRAVDMQLKFDKRFARVATDMFANDRKETREDGSVIVHASMPEDGWLYGFLLSFGTYLEVIEPVRLRELLGEEGRRIAEMYQRSSGS